MSYVYTAAFPSFLAMNCKAERVGAVRGPGTLSCQCVTKGQEEWLGWHWNFTTCWGAAGVRDAIFRRALPRLCGPNAEEPVSRE